MSIDPADALRHLGDGCAITETAATVCVATPPIPATGINQSAGLLLALALIVTGLILTRRTRRG